MEDFVEPAACTAREFSARQRQQWKHFNAPGKRIGNPRQRHDVGRPGEKETSGATVCVHGELDGQQQLGHSLHFVDHHGVQALDEALRVLACRLQRGAVVESQIVAAGRSELPHQRGLAGLSRTVDQDYGRIFQRVDDAAA